MFHPSACENARPDGFGVLEVDGDAGQARREARRRKETARRARSGRRGPRAR
jgi:hypothetical protein